jgi:hypothetical protein
MTDYTTYPQIFLPEPIAAQGLLAVRVPVSMQTITEADYRTLISQRIGWLIQTWMEQTGETQHQTHNRLTSALFHLNSSQQPPRLTDPEAQPLWTWMEIWAETFVTYNDRLMQELEQEFPATIPVPVMPEVLEQQIAAHDSITLADWLADLTYGMTTEAVY